LGISAAVVHIVLVVKCRTESKIPDAMSKLQC